MAGLALHLWRLSIPPQYVFDEIYYVPAARALIANQRDPNWVHPPLGKGEIAASISLFGDRPFAWRLPSVIAAAFAVGFFYLLALDLFQSQFLAFYAGLLYLMDGLSFVQARLATLDMIGVGFLLPSLYFFRKEKYPLCSLFFALSLSCKWTALFALPVFLFSKIPLNRNALRTLTLHVLLPSIFIYLLIFRLLTFGDNSFTHTFSLRNEWYWMKTMVTGHISAVKFHLRPSMEHPYKAPWWKWLLLIRPIWYAYQKHGDVIQGIIALPNPLLWWPAVLALLGLFLNVLGHIPKKKDLSECVPYSQLNGLQSEWFILLGALSFLVPWMFSMHGGFLYYLLPVAPFLILCLIDQVREDRTLLLLIFLLSLAGFILFFPIYSDWPISPARYHHLIWLKTWT